MTPTSWNSRTHGNLCCRMGFSLHPPHLSNTKRNGQDEKKQVVVKFRPLKIGGQECVAVCMILRCRGNTFYIRTMHTNLQSACGCHFGRALLRSHTSNYAQPVKMRLHASISPDQALLRHPTSLTVNACDERLTVQQHEG